jgi:epoxyqueuosine reductase
MAYMQRHEDVRLDPESFFPGVRTVVAAALNYYRPEPARPPGAPKISRYAWGRDYHKVLKSKLNRFLERIRELAPETSGRAAVDTSPVLDKVWAAAAGLGWQGKHTNLITRTHGSWVFLGTLWIDLALPPDLPSPDFCGSCTRCLDACPTGAFPRPYVLDSRRCITYWNVEHRGAFGETTPPLRGWLFGCDICQDVCPWNKFRRETGMEDFAPRRQALELTTEDWERLDARAFDDATRGSAMRRARMEGLKRNAARVLEERLSPERRSPSTEEEIGER